MWKTGRATNFLNIIKWAELRFHSQWKLVHLLLSSICYKGKLKEELLTQLRIRIKNNWKRNMGRKALNLLF